jgi:protein-S-isoprenylcysteine O-methyltransferase Ste14
MHSEDFAGANNAAASRKRTGELKPATGSLEGAKAALAPALEQPIPRDLAVRAGETAILLAAIIGAIALGLGISEYLGEHPYVAAYLVAYMAFRFADLLVRDEEALGLDRARFARRVMYELPLLAVFFAAPFERTFIYGGEAPQWLGALGLLIELMGLWLALGARIQLGFFSPGNAEEAHRGLVRGGLYRHIRHPIYAGEFLVIAAWPLEYGAPVTLALTIIVGFIALRRRIRDEEAEMVARFGDEYAEYMRATDNILPNVW